MARIVTIFTFPEIVSFRIGAKVVWFTCGVRVGIQVVGWYVVSNLGADVVTDVGANVVKGGVLFVTLVSGEAQISVRFNAQHWV
jgi:hypothetical protein